MEKRKSRARVAAAGASGGGGEAARREERVASLCALAGNRAASKQEGGPGRGAGKHLRACQCSEEERSDGLGFREE